MSSCGWVLLIVGSSDCGCCLLSAAQVSVCLGVCLAGRVLPSALVILLAVVSLPWRVRDFSRLAVLVLHSFRAAHFTSCSRCLVFLSCVEGFSGFQELCLCGAASFSWIAGENVCFW